MGVKLGVSDRQSGQNGKAGTDRQVDAPEPAAAENIKADETLDVTAIQCPITFAKTLLKLEDMQVGQILEVFLNEGEPIRSVPGSIAGEGHKIIKIEQVSEKVYRVLIERGE